MVPPLPRVGVVFGDGWSCGEAVADRSVVGIKRNNALIASVCQPCLVCAALLGGYGGPIRRIGCFRCERLMPQGLRFGAGLFEFENLVLGVHGNG
jgi:hypothetical protein